ncbi:MAG: aldehyde ferredoxin oxidoreductase family protein [Pseudomonadota bacterium]
MENQILGYPGKILEINLNTKENTTLNIPENYFKDYLGGKGLALKLLSERLDVGTDPLSSENIIVFSTGVLTSTNAPCSGRFSAVTKSPLTGLICHSSCGGPFGLALKTAGFDVLIIKGALNKPSFITINDQDIDIKRADGLWGIDTQKVQEKLGEYGDALVIGPAGEKLVRFANIVSGSRYLGRAGMGAVLGSKKIKAICVKGDLYSFKPVKKKLFSKTRRKAISYINQNNMTSNLYRNFGTSANVRVCNQAKILPVKNFTKGSSKLARKISGEEIKKKHETKYHTCKPCSILCGKKGVFNNREKTVPEYETIGLLGSNLEIFDPSNIAEFNEICGLMGMDTISAGSVIGFTMEAYEKGLLSQDISFGNSEHIVSSLKDIASLTGFGAEMARGVKYLSEKYGGKEFAIHVKGLEMPAYDPRGSFGQGLSYAVANRGACHLSTAIFTMECFFKLLKPHTIRAKADFVKFFEDLYSCINSLHICQFTAFAYLLESPLTKFTPKFLLAFLMQNLPSLAIALIDFGIYKEFFTSQTGIKISNKDFIKAGERIHVLERKMNAREGLNRKDDTLPDRFLNESRKDDSCSRVVPLKKLLDKYYKKRGYDKNGIPGDKLLKELNIGL